MSVHSDHYESYEEEKRAMYYEYEWDSFNEYHDPEDHGADPRERRTPINVRSDTGTDDNIRFF